MYLGFFALPPNFQLSLFTMLRNFKRQTRSRSWGLARARPELTENSTSLWYSAPGGTSMTRHKELLSVTVRRLMVNEWRQVRIPYLCRVNPNPPNEGVWEAC